MVLPPSAEWIGTLPNGKLPDRNDFKAYGGDLAGRVRPGGGGWPKDQRTGGTSCSGVGAGPTPS